MAISPTQAIGDFWISRADISGQFSGPLYAGEAPETVVAMPYAVLIEVGGPANEVTTNFTTYRSAYQISVMAGNLAQAESLAKLVRDGINRATLTISGATVMHCLAGETHWTIGKGLGIKGQDCWVCYVEFEIFWAR